MTEQADFKRRVRARMARTGESYTAARRQLVEAQQRRQPDEAEQVGDNERMAAALHITNGDSTDLAGTGLARRVLVWFDVLHEGPVPAVPDEELRRIRADFLAADVPVDAAGAEFALRRFRERDEVLAANRDGEYVLWFEADLYDQLQIIQILARLAELDVAPDRITLICIGEHPGIAHFGGLGELGASQLRALPGSGAASRLTAGALDLARRAWAAFRAPDPGGLGGLIRTRSAELRFLGEAFDRLSREYPSTRDGLSLTERRILAACAATEANGADGAFGADGASGATEASGANGEGDNGQGGFAAADVFGLVAGREARPYLGDTWCFAAMSRLVGASVPLLATDPPAQPVDGSTRLRLTAAGERVLAGRADHVRLNGVDRWIGGVHLLGHEPAWRFDEGTETLVPGDSQVPLR